MKIKKQILHVVLYMIICTNLHAQKQFEKWYFGSFAGLDFSSGVPVPLTNSAMFTVEGSSSISDTSGNLLFYTDGLSVYNALHVAMPNGIGLAGGGSSTQSALILPMPGNVNLYYIFTVPDFASLGFNYSIVDMTLQGGLGDVTAKNTFLLGNVSEKLSAVYHANGTDVWVCVHSYTGDAFHSFLVTPLGINAPVVSNCGSPFSLSSTIGYLRFSPTGNKAAQCLFDLNAVDIFDFDNSTGVLSNAATFAAGTNFYAYGLEFSSTGKTLYASSDQSQGEIYQFDMQAGSQSAIVASAVNIYTQNNNGGALLSGPDGKIYFTDYQLSSLGVINYPDSLGLSCNVVDFSIPLGSGASQIGLPNYLAPKYTPLNVAPVVNLQSSDTIFCEKQCIDFNDLSTNNPTSWQWNFAGASPSTSTDQNPSGICYNNYGSFDVTLIACNSAGCDTLLLPGFINEYQIPAPTITQSGDTLFSSLAVSYQWYSVDSGLIIGAVNYNYIPTYAGSFYVIVTDTNGCEGASNTIVITGVYSLSNYQHPIIIFQILMMECLLF
ncbi:MAG: hypothetical protein IPP29_23365 [Bacteroidetes bacterium]|nr:hypothetical protein [Bacteroidota bacterium]